MRGGIRMRSKNIGQRMWLTWRYRYGSNKERKKQTPEGCDQIPLGSWPSPPFWALPILIFIRLPLSSLYVLFCPFKFAQAPAQGSGNRLSERDLTSGPRKREKRTGRGRKARRDRGLAKWGLPTIVCVRVGHRVISIMLINQHFERKSNECRFKKKKLTLLTSRHTLSNNTPPIHPVIKRKINEQIVEQRVKSSECVFAQ